MLRLEADGSFDEAALVVGNLDVGGRGTAVPDGACVPALLVATGGMDDLVLGRTSPRATCSAGVDAALDLSEAVVSRLAGEAEGAMDSFPATAAAVDDLAEGRVGPPGRADRRLVVPAPSVPK